MSEISYLTLAALATLAVPDLDVQALCPPQRHEAGRLSTGILDSQSRRWICLAATDSSSDAALHKQGQILTMLGNYSDAHRLSVQVPRFEGTTTTSQGFQAVVYRTLPGSPLNFEELEGDSQLLRALGKSIASFHELPPNLVQHAGFPVRNIEETRLELHDNLGRGVATGLVPPELQARWERALDVAAWWKFHPTFLHGNLSPENVLVADSRVLSVQGFNSVSIGDPARDLVWLVDQLEPESADLIFDAYHLGRAEGADPYLRQRVELYLELALVDWLNWGVESGDPNIINDAEQMLSHTLDALGAELSMTGNPLFEDTKNPDAPTEEYPLPAQIDPLTDAAEPDPSTAQDTPETEAKPQVTDQIDMSKFTQDSQDIE